MKEFKKLRAKEHVEVNESDSRVVARVRVTPRIGCDEITYGWFLDVEKESGNYNASLGRFTSGYAPDEWDMYSRDTRVDVHTTVPKDKLIQLREVVRAFVKFARSKNEKDYQAVIKKMKEVIK